MAVTSERYPYNSVLDTIRVTFVASDMGQNALFTADNDEGCNVNLNYFGEKLRGDGTYVTEFEVEKAETGYVPWYIAAEKESSQFLSGCISEEPEIVPPSASIVSFTASRNNPTGSSYTFNAVFNNLDSSIQVFVRSQAGTPECTLPEFIPEDTSANGTRMALELKETGETSSPFSSSVNLTITLLLFDENNNFLDAKSICQDWAQ